MAFQAIDGQEHIGLLEACCGLAFLGMELRGKGEDGAATLFVMCGDVHDKRWADVRESRGIENLERSVWFAAEGQLLEASKEAAFVAERGGVVVVGVAGLPIRKDDGFGAKLANDGG